MTKESGESRAQTPLALKLKESIRRDGSMSVAGYMQACLQDSEHGYYRRQPVLGTGGDFVTAPEISQVFGELIGLWCAVVWQQMGSPASVNLIELGPGRGTLMRDALRASRIVPGFRDALSIHLVDSNEVLRELQRAMLAESGLDIHFHHECRDVLALASHVRDYPTVVIANEFLDTLPVEQFVYGEGAWRARTIGLDGERLCFDTATHAPAGRGAFPTFATPHDGDVLEVCPDHRNIAEDLRTRAQLGPLAALFIDYGHEKTGFGDTLQGVASQKHVSPFHAPGETDLSAQVDFQHFADACAGAGLNVDGPLPQAEFLGRLGIIERASRLMSANPAQASTIEAGVARLLAPTGMGSRFLALGVRSAGLPPLPGFG
jgi:NADH dehydrogenase [ubiquinone] 1 alpha subcomplex assembly factor 7